MMSVLKETKSRDSTAWIHTRRYEQRSSYCGLLLPLLQLFVDKSNKLSMEEVPSSAVAVGESHESDRWKTFSQSIGDCGEGLIARDSGSSWARLSWVVEVGAAVERVGGHVDGVGHGGWCSSCGEFADTAGCVAYGTDATATIVGCVRVRASGFGVQLGALPIATFGGTVPTIGAVVVVPAELSSGGGQNC